MVDRYGDTKLTSALTGFSAGDPDRVAAELFEWSRRLVGIDSGVVFVLEMDEVVARYTFETPGIALGKVRLRLDGSGTIQDTLRRGVSQVSTGVDLFLGMTPRWATSACIPMRIDGTPIGVYLANWDVDYPISRETLLVLEGAAAMAASAIYGARLLADVKREQQRLQSLIDILPIPAIQFRGPDFQIDQLNAEARRLLGDVRGRTLFDLGSTAHAEPLIGPEITKQSTVKALSLEAPARRLRLLTPDGSQRTVLPHITRFGKDGGVVMLVDITNEASLEARRHRFIRMVSHHLRTPLTPLQGYAAILESAEVSSEVIRRAAGDIGSATTEILHHVERLEQIANLQPADPGSLQDVLAIDLITSAWAASGGKPKDLKQIGDVAIRVRCKPENLTNALAEVFTNAHVHGNPPVKASVTRSNGTVEIEVEDAGHGISSDWASAVFAPYVDAKPGYAAPSGGLGLGLTLARGLTEASQGELSLEHGSFIFRLPAGVEAPSGVSQLDPKPDDATY